MPFSEDDALALFEQANALRIGHFLLTSGRHANHYVLKDALYPYTLKVQRLCQAIAGHFAHYAIDIDAVVAPEKGGIILSQYVAHHLTEIRSDGKQVLALFAEKNAASGEFEFRRGYGDHVPGSNILVVEDVLTTGGSVNKVIQLVWNLQGVVMGVGALWNRGGVTDKDLGVLELYSTVERQFPSWMPDECPFCAENVPIDLMIGHGKGAPQQQASA